MLWCSVVGSLAALGLVGILMSWCLNLPWFVRSLLSFCCHLVCAFGSVFVVAFAFACICVCLSVPKRGCVNRGVHMVGSRFQCCGMRDQRHLWLESVKQIFLDTFATNCVDKFIRIQKRQMEKCEVHTTFKPHPSARYMSKKSS